MRWPSFIPRKPIWVPLFKVAKRRVTDQTDDMAEAPNARIDSATEGMNQIVDHVHDAQDAPDGVASGYSGA